MIPTAPMPSSPAARRGPTRCAAAWPPFPPMRTVIVVHDAARPLASPALFAAVIAAVTDGGADGAVPGVPPSDTIKAVDESGRVTDTLDRATLVAVQTPQAFRAALLRRAHDGRVEPVPPTTPCWSRRWAARVQVVPGEPGNLKITDPDDLGAAERLLAAAGGVR